MPKDDAYWKRKLEELDMSSTSPPPATPPDPIVPDPMPSETPTLSGLYQQFRAWFALLPTAGQAVVLLGGGILALSVVRTLVQVVTFGLSLGLFLLLAYGAYRFLNQGGSDDRA